MAGSRQQSLFGPMNRLFRFGTASGFSDNQLLEQFVNRHDEAAEAAFAAILDRHGSMVLNVCQRVLSNQDDAQDAFQATFLILVRQAGSIKRRDSLASWLYGVALRVSARSKTASARRRMMEQHATGRSDHGSESRDDLSEVCEEVDRLPQSLRAAVVLCYFEGLTHEQAAARLGWPVGTVRSRLTRAREQLRTRLTRQGFGTSSSFLSLLPAHSAIASLPNSLFESTVKAAMFIAARDAFEAGFVSASASSLTEGVLHAMFLTKIQKIAVAITMSVLIATASSFAYQASRTGIDATSPISAAEQPSEHEQSTVRTRKLAWYATTIERFVRSATNHQVNGDLKAAAEDTASIQRLAHEWNWMVNHMDADRFPDSMYEPSFDPSSRHLPSVGPDEKTSLKVASDPLVRLAPTAPPSADVVARLDAIERRLKMISEGHRRANSRPDDFDSMDAPISKREFSKTQAVPKGHR